jgi:deoxyribonuclease-4
MAHFFGAHTPDAGGIHMAVRRAARAGMRALQIFTAKPQFYNEKISVKPERVTRFTTAVRDTGFEKERVLAHAAYVLNTASPEPDKHARSALGLARELERADALGILGVCFHPGSAGSSDPAAAIERVAEAMTKALEGTKGEARLFVENTAGGGRTMGRTAAEVGRMLELLPKKLRKRAGYGLDTCHLFSSGLDITASESAFRAIIDEFVDATGENPAFFHLNDSEGALGSNRDRHVLLGEGKIGLEPFRWLLADRRSHDVPLILETPQTGEELGEDDDTPDAYDVRMMKLLEKLAR